MPCETVLVEDRELVHCCFPVLRCATPISGYVAQSEPDQLAGRFGGGEMAARFYDFTQLGVDALDRVRSVNHAPHRRWEREERNHIGPSATPRSDYGREFLTPRPSLENRQLALGRFRANGGVNGLDRRSQRLALLPTGIVQAVSDQVHDARLQRGFRVPTV